MLKLMGYWRSTAAYRVRIALNLKQVSYDNVSVHLVKDGGEQHKPEFRKLNPQGLVPLLIDGQQSISQSMAIIEYLEEKYPSPQLLPDDLSMRASIRAVCQMIACDVHPLNNLRVLQYLQGSLDATEEQKNAWYAHWILEGFKAIESVIQPYAEQGDYCFGENITMADTFLIPQVYNANRFNVSLDAFPRIQSVNEACLKRSAFIDALPENQPDAVN